MGGCRGKQDGDQRKKRLRREKMRGQAEHAEYMQGSERCKAEKDKDILF